MKPDKDCLVHSGIRAFDFGKELKASYSKLLLKKLGELQIQQSTWPIQTGHWEVESDGRSYFVTDNEQT